MRFGSKGADPGIVAGPHAEAIVVASEQRLEIEREPVGRERSHGIIFVGVWVEGLLLLLLLLLLWLLVLGGRGGLREGVYKVGVTGVEEGGGGVVVADRGHDGDVAVVGGVVSAGYTCQRTIVRVEAPCWVTVLRIVIGRKLGLLLVESGGALGLLGGG